MEIIDMGLFSIDAINKNVIYVNQKLTKSGSVAYQTLLKGSLVTAKTSQTVVNPAPAVFKNTNIQYFAE